MFFGFNTFETEAIVKKESKIIRAYGDNDVSLRRNIDFGSLIGRKVIEFSPSCGTYGQGGPGFVGFNLEADESQSGEWLILCLWGAACWLKVNGQCLGAHPEQYNIHRPLMSNFSGQKWDEFSPQVVGANIKRFDVSEKSFIVDIGEAHIVLSEDPNDRPLYPVGKLRDLMPVDDLRQAWKLAIAPWVNV